MRSKSLLHFGFGQTISCARTSFPSLSAIVTFLAFNFIAYIYHSSAIMTAGSRCRRHRKRESRHHVNGCKRSDCPPKLLIQAFRSEVFNHVSEGLHREFSTVRPIHSEFPRTWAILLDSFRFGHQIKRIRKILFQCLRFICHRRGYALSTVFSTAVSPGELGLPLSRGFKRANDLDRRRTSGRWKAFRGACR